MTEITIEHSRGYVRWSCNVCGETQDKDGQRSLLVQNDDSDSMNICRACLQAGPEGAIERAKKYANLLQDHAKFLVEGVPDIVHAVGVWKTGADYDAVLEAGESV
jgi:hypothetical protein